MVDFAYALTTDTLISVQKVDYPLPNVDMLLDTLVGAKVYSALDLSQGFHQLRLKDEDNYKTSFITQYGQ